MRDKRILFALLAIFACGLIAAGCGSDDSGETTPEVTAEDSAGGETSTTTVTPEDINEQLENLPDDLDEALENVPNLDEAIAQCKQGVENSGLSGDQKAQALQICEAAADLGGG